MPFLKYNGGNQRHACCNCPSVDDLALVHEQFALAQRGVAGVAAALYHLDN